MNIGRISFPPTAGLTWIITLNRFGIDGVGGVGECQKLLGHKDEIWNSVKWYTVNL